MTENQKLREALQAIANIDDATNHSVDASAALDRIGQIARQALALPPDVPETTFRGMREALQLIAWSNDSKWQADCARQALALPTADHLPDAGEMVVDHFPDATKMIETAAPVGEREAFEREMSKPPFEFCMDRWPDDGSYAWPGNYAAYHTQCAWAAWQARAALSAGDAVDAQRYRWLKGRSQVCLNQVWFGGYTTRQLDGDFLSRDSALSAIESAIDAAMRKDKP